METREIVKRYIFFFIGLFIMAFGVTFSIKASLGTSPISSVPYTTSYISGLSVGKATIIMNCVFILLQIAILRKQFEWIQLMQFPATIIFGYMIDLAGYIINRITFTNYVQQWILCIIGIILVGLGVSCEVAANVITNAGEGVVLSICKVFPVKFGNAKVAFDVTLVCISILISFLCLGRLEGVREGTIVAAIFVGQIAKLLNKPLKKVEKVLLS